MRRLYNLRRRLERSGIGPGEPTYDKTTAAIDAMHDLRVHVHYASCESGVGDCRPVRAKR